MKREMISVAVHLSKAVLSGKVRIWGGKGAIELKRGEPGGMGLADG